MNIVIADMLAVACDRLKAGSPMTLSHCDADLQVPQTLGRVVDVVRGGCS